MYREVFGFTDRTIHQSELSKLLFNLYQEGLTPPQVNHVQSSRLSGLGRVLLQVKPHNVLTQLAESTRLGFLTRTASGTYTLATPP